MKALIAAALVAAFSLVQAKEVARFHPPGQGNVHLRLFDEQGACPSDKLVRVELHVDGKKLNDGCAYDDGNIVHVLWDDGDIGRVPRKMFKPGV